MSNFCLDVAGFSKIGTPLFVDFWDVHSFCTGFDALVSSFITVDLDGGNIISSSFKYSFSGEKLDGDTVERSMEMVLWIPLFTVSAVAEMTPYVPVIFGLSFEGTESAVLSASVNVESGALST